MNKVKKIFLVVVFGLFIIGVIAFMSGIIYYYNSLGCFEKSENGQEVKVQIAEGTSIAEIAELLNEKKIIKNPFTFKVYLKLNNKINLQAGTYVFNNGKDNLEQVVTKLNMGEVFDESVTITFVEGKNMRYIAKTISEHTNNTEEEVYEILEDSEYIKSLIDEYWFITEEITDENIYYPLEGYLFPDTYTFKNKNISVKEIFNHILGYTDKYLSSHRAEIEEAGLTVHQLLTLASIAELEGSNFEDRQEIIGVFYNRLEKQMTLGSDVTTYYAVKKEMADGDLTKAEINIDNPYNTRNSNMAGYIPIGPIDNPSKDSIEATIKPKETDAYYFVADKNKKVYFSKDYKEHQTMIKDLKDANLWYEY